MEKAVMWKQSDLYHIRRKTSSLGGNHRKMILKSKIIQTVLEGLVREWIPTSWEK